MSRSLLPIHTDTNVGRAVIITWTCVRPPRINWARGLIGVIAPPLRGGSAVKADDRPPRAQGSGRRQVRHGDESSSAPLERVAERQPEELCVKVVDPGIQPGGRHLIEDRLAGAATPIVLLDVLGGDVRR